MRERGPLSISRLSIDLRSEKQFPILLLSYWPLPIQVKSCFPDIFIEILRTIIEGWRVLLYHYSGHWYTIDFMLLLKLAITIPKAEATATWLCNLRVHWPVI